MAIAATLRTYLTQHRIEHEVVTHPRALSSSQSAAAAHVPGDRLAKAVLLQDEQGYLLVVVPATHRVDLGRLHQRLGMVVGLATEDEVAARFPDCDRGAIPPTGFLYGIDTIVDEVLTEQPEVWFEAGDHEELVHVAAAEFARMFSQARRMRLSHHV